MINYKFNFKGRKIEIDLKKCGGIMQGMGLMFRTGETEALLFEMKNKAIHSLFCPRFLAVWLDEKDNVVDYKLVKSWKGYIKSNRDFSKLIEIPVGKRYKAILKVFKY